MVEILPGSGTYSTYGRLFGIFDDLQKIKSSIVGHEILRRYAKEQVCVNTSIPSISEEKVNGEVARSDEKFATKLTNFREKVHEASPSPPSGSLT